MSPILQQESDLLIGYGGHSEYAFSTIWIERFFILIKNITCNETIERHYEYKGYVLLYSMTLHKNSFQQQEQKQIQDENDRIESIQRNGIAYGHRNKNDIIRNEM
mmetsp:Transcript_49494/g.57112  ORF Transcript_49494/g.57112 Transcript_49494/m.57112 type:complete len:105 (+) Transcript_49494:397-711(+)